MQRLLFFFIFILFASGANAQNDSEILKIILSEYYKTEKVVVKDRTQFLFLYCEKPNNNEQIFETLNDMNLPKSTIAKLKKEALTDTKPETWQTNLDELYSSGKFSIKNKVNSCFSLDEYQIEYKKRNVNNQRLMIISKPLYYGNHAIVKVVFYRTIEHNNGSVLHLEKINNKWVISESLNPWST